MLNEGSNKSDMDPTLKDQSSDLLVIYFFVLFLVKHHLSLFYILPIF